MKDLLRRVTYRLGLRDDPNTSFLRRIHGLIHVGANVGQERDLYESFGLQVLWIEPIPDVFRKLSANIAGVPNQRALNYLITQEDGKEHELHISNNAGESSSLLDFADHKRMWPDVAYDGSITLPGVTLPTALERENIDLSSYDGLVLDTQGTEFQILQGAAGILTNFRFAKVEVPDFESYKGCAQIEQLSAFMKAHGFREEHRSPFSHRDGIGTYFDVIYRQRGGRGGAHPQAH